MSDDAAVRLWLGWRAGHIASSESGWKSFKKSLAETFIPATWEIMSGFGLRTYVPSVFSPTGADGLPEEVALLCYSTEQAYEASKASVVGRAYAVMHRALFEFDAAVRKSKAAWAGSQDPDKPTLRAAAGGGKRFEDAGAVLHVLLLACREHAPSVQAIAGALAGQTGSLAIWCQPRFALVWIAAAEPLDQTVVCAPVLASLPGASVAAFHQAVAAPAIDQLRGVPAVDRQSWHFHG